MSFRFLTGAPRRNQITGVRMAFLTSGKTARRAVILLSPTVCEALAIAPGSHVRIGWGEPGTPDYGMMLLAKATERDRGALKVIPPKRVEGKARQIQVSLLPEWVKRERMSSQDVEFTLQDGAVLIRLPVDVLAAPPAEAITSVEPPRKPAPPASAGKPPAPCQDEDTGDGSTAPLILIHEQVKAEVGYLNTKGHRITYAAGVWWDNVNDRELSPEKIVEMAARKRELEAGAGNKAAAE